MSIRRFSRSVSQGALVLLMLGLATPDGFSETPESSPPGGAAEPAPLPRTIQRIGLRTPEKQGVFRPWYASGTLTFGVDAIKFESKKISLTIPTASIWRVGRTELSNRTGTGIHYVGAPLLWCVVEYDEGGLTRTAAFIDGRIHGPDIGIDAAIFAELQRAEARGRSDPASVRRESTPGTGAEGRMDESLVEMRHYSFKMPSYGGWRLERKGGPGEEAVLTKELGSTSYGEVGHVQIKILKNQILSKRWVGKTAQENADKVRSGERETMIKEGVKRGLYQLHDVSMDEATISGKRFFFMDYTTETPTDIEPSSLYLLFPHERDNTTFLMVVYTAVINKSTGATDVSKPDLMSLLGSLDMKSEDQAGSSDAPRD